MLIGANTHKPLIDILISGINLRKSKAEYVGLISPLVYPWSVFY